MKTSWLIALATCSATRAFVACSSDDSSNNTTADSGTPATDSGNAPDSPAVDSSAPVSVTFSYDPGWAGVSAVAVLGGFGQTSDWTMPLVTLKNDGSGHFSGSAMLPPGSYPYVFKVTGDAQAGTASATMSRYAIDPAVSAFVACPMASPTFSKIDSNPCSQLVVPQGAADPAFHVKGVVNVDGAPAPGYLVEIEREEPMSHHFFANRVTTGADGAFDMKGAKGNYRIQVLHPSYLTTTDQQLDPVKLGTLRRQISAAFMVAADVTLPPVELSFHTYASFSPTGATTLPTTFGWTSTLPSRVTVYGTGMDGGSPEIGDPWFAGALTGGGTATFDGGFNTKQAAQTAVNPGERYFWGIEELDAVDGGVSWTAQTMVLPITWN